MLPVSLDGPVLCMPDELLGVFISSQAGVLSNALLSTMKKIVMVDPVCVVVPASASRVRVPSSWLNLVLRLQTTRASRQRCEPFQSDLEGHDALAPNRSPSTSRPQNATASSRPATSGCPAAPPPFGSLRRARAGRAEGVGRALISIRK